MSEITELLDRAGRGDGAAVNVLLPMIYDQLRAIAHRQLAQDPRQRTLATTALVHETYLAVFGGAELAWPDRARFFAYTAKAMRNILIDSARRRMAEKRGGSSAHVDLADIEIAVDDNGLDLLALDQALTTMASDHPRLVSVVELRFFAGLSVDDTAAALAVDPRTVKRDWQKAHAYINRALGRTGDPSPAPLPG
ncbi:MAG TPA: ECF-type sigma factor [Xanthomonadaceae bacterium]|jgi:RNA polymerase sigma factor (TIGR02999 family)